MSNRFDAEELERIFHPRSIAFVGISPKPTNWASQTFPRALIDAGYEGVLYPVSRKVSEVCGLKTYPSIRDIPGAVDYVMCNVPAPSTPNLMEDCVAKGVKAAHIFTSGFSETSGEEGSILEAKITGIARRGGIRIIGPNCPGVYCPESHLSFGFGFPRDSGPVGWFSQSGGHCIRFVRLGATRGVRFTKAIGYGNGCDLNEADFLEYFGHDAKTRIIAGYIEGVKEGRRFFETLTEVAKVKPVIIHKGGHTTAGTRATASHTGALTVADEVWDAVCHQSRVIRAHSIDELVDTVLAFLYLPPLQGRNVGIVGYGGGPSVQAADDCESAGLFVPPFPQEIREALRKFTPDANNSVRNPVDTEWLVWGTEEFANTVRLISNWEGVDFLLAVLAIDMFPLIKEQSLINEMVDNVIASVKSCSKPMVIVLHPSVSAETATTVIAAQERLYCAGLPVYPSVARAAAAISRFIGWHG